MRRRLDIQLPIVLASVAVALSIALLVAWVLVVARTMHLTRQVGENVWLLVAGVVSFVLIIGVLVVFSVILVREALELRRQTTFIDSVTHELKSPLASLKLCVETMDRPELDAEQHRTLRRMMLADLDRLTVFIDDVLDASRIAHGRRKGVLGPVRLKTLVEQCIAVVAARHGAPRSAFTLLIPEDLELVTDATALETVLTNLLDNAVKYSDPPARVAVEAALADERVRVSVIDHGIGIPPRERKRIFERFYRVSSEAVRTRRGTGLGLYVVQALVRGLGGEVQVSSDGEGAGTRFVVSLPARPAVGAHG